MRFKLFFFFFKDYRLIYMWEITFFQFLKLASSSIFSPCLLLRFFFFGIITTITDKTRGRPRDLRPKGTSAPSRGLTERLPGESQYTSEHPALDTENYQCTGRCEHQPLVGSLAGENSPHTWGSLRCAKREGESKTKTSLF